MEKTYKILEAFGYGDKLNAINNLSAQVNDHMKNGWRPQGGVQIGFQKPEMGEAYWYAVQAMVRDESYKRPLKDPAELANDPKFFGEGLA